MGTFQLPAAPDDQTEPVKAWMEAVVIPTYEPLPADRNPMFLEKRVYQGSSGKVYPLPFTDRICETKTDRRWQAVHVENEFIRVMILPEIGGRIHVGLDKTNGYDFFYRQNVIKPALVGLAGPWISGGVEFNWPQHHRPSTFMPVDVDIEKHADGSITVWCSEHEPMNRMKGMHGVCLHPGRSFIELKARLYNRTQFVQTFLWWANVAARVHEQYQSFFPPDVFYVADHAKRAMSTYPQCTGRYYGVDYAGRGRTGVPPLERPSQFVPTGGYSANDLSWYANIPVPTSYMCMGTREDFFGGYDHQRRAGLVHTANHHVSPGKKQWTWGNHAFGYAWDRNLTDEDGPYIELMAGVYTDNQPDFSFLAPGETRTFSQYWYPIREIGPAQHANRDAAVSLHLVKGMLRVGVCVSAVFAGARVTLLVKGQVLAAFQRDLNPGAPLIETLAVARNLRGEDLEVRVATADGHSLLTYKPRAMEKGDVPPPATEPSLPKDIATNDELYLTGLHLEQYRHATRCPEDYWREALARDPHDCRCNNAMGLWHLRRGEFTEAEAFFRNAIATLTRRNPNPYDNEAYYNLGLTLRYLDRPDEAYAALYKATWNQAWQSAAYYALAEIDCSRGQWATALEHLDRALRVNVEDLKARDLRAIVLRKLGQAEQAQSLLRETLRLDPLDHWARQLLGEQPRCDTQTLLDIALDLARAGLYAEALGLLACAQPERGSGTAPLLSYYRGYLAFWMGKTAQGFKHWRAAAAALPDYCFPSKLEELVILQCALTNNPTDARGLYYLGNWMYDRRRHREAIRLWEHSARCDGKFSIVWRNLGIAYFNVLRNPAKAKWAYDNAFRANRADARILYERDQLWKRLGEVPAKRLKELERYPELVRHRDDLSVELASLYNQTGQHEKALALITTRRFQPWEGGEGLALGQHVRTHLALGRRALKECKTQTAQRYFEAALASPENLGEAKHLLANQSDIHYWLGVAYATAGDERKMRHHWTIAAGSAGDFQQMAVREHSEMTYYRALAMQRLGRVAEARKLLQDLARYAHKLASAPARIDYFATSLPTMLLFDADLAEQRTTTAVLLEALACLGLGKKATGQRLLRKVLRLDVNHATAADLLAESKRARNAAVARRLQMECE